MGNSPRKQTSNNATLSDFSQPIKLVSIPTKKDICDSGQANSTKHISSPPASTIGSNPNHE
jgi:hypothetical protein